MKIIKNILGALGLLLVAGACNTDEIDNIPATEIHELSLQGKAKSITLSWTYVLEEGAENTNRVVEIRYQHPRTKKDVRKTVSAYSNSIVIEDVSREDGEYKFSVQPFSTTMEAGKVRYISGKAAASDESNGEETLDPVEVKNITVTPDVQSVTLAWEYDMPEGGFNTNSHVEIAYTDPVTGKEVTKVVAGTIEPATITISPITDEFEYTFMITPVSMTNNRGITRSVTGTPLPLPPVPAVDIKRESLSATSDRVGEVELTWEYDLPAGETNKNRYVLVKYTPQGGSEADMRTEKINGCPTSAVITNIGGSYEFEVCPYSETGVAGEPCTITGTALTVDPVAIRITEAKAYPGMVRLRWEYELNGGENTTARIEVSYMHQGKEVKSVIERKDGIAPYETLVTGLDYNVEYEFTLRPYTLSTAGEAVSVKVTSSPNANYESEEFNLSVDDYDIYWQTSSQYGGEKGAMIDGNPDTYINMDFDNPSKAPFYIDFTYPENQEVIHFYYQNRKDNGYFPVKIECYVKSEQDENWTLVKTLAYNEDKLPIEAGEVYTSGYYEAGMSFKYFRFKVLETTGGSTHPNFSLAEFKLYKVTR